MKDIIDKLNDEMDKAVEAKNFDLAGSIMTKMWLQFQIMLTMKNAPELKELNFIKSPVDTGDGKYLLLFIHVDGNKIKLQGE